MLLRLCNSKLKKKWRNISEILGTKTASQCSYKFKLLQKNNNFGENKDFLLSDEKIKKYFKKKYNILMLKNKEKEISTFCLKSEPKPSISNANTKLNTLSTTEQKDTEDFYKLFDNYYNIDNVDDVTDCLAKDQLNSTTNDINNTKLIKVKIDDEIELKRGITSMSSINKVFDNTFKINSIGMFFKDRTISNLIRRDTAEFKKQFDHHFEDSEEQEDFLLSASDFKLINFLPINLNTNNTVQSNTVTISNTEKDVSINLEIIERVESFLNSMTNLSAEDLDGMYEKMTNLLIEINPLTNENNEYRDLMIKALELQSKILYNMIMIISLKINS